MKIDTDNGLVIAFVLISFVALIIAAWFVAKELLP